MAPGHRNHTPRSRNFFSPKNRHCSTSRCMISMLRVSRLVEISMYVCSTIVFRIQTEAGSWMMQWPPANEGNFFVCLFAPRKAGQLKIHRFYLFRAFCFPGKSRSRAGRPAPVWPDFAIWAVFFSVGRNVSEKCRPKFTLISSRFGLFF
jgi:hypothetical protein